MAAMRDSTGLEPLARRSSRGKIDREKDLEKRGDILTSPVTAFLATCLSRYRRRARGG